jgi:CRP-like cAMP-binding protein
MNLPSCQLFEGFSDGHCECFFDLIEDITCKQGEWIFREGDPAEQLYCIKQGAVELVTSIDDEIELPITILRSEGNYFGTSSLIPPYTCSLSAKAYEDTTLAVIHRDKLMHQINLNPELGYIIMSNLAKTFLDRLKETRQEIKIHFKSLIKVMQY